MPSPPPMKRDPLRIEVCRDAEDLARHAAQSFVSIAGMALGSRGRFDVALAGGEAARRMYGVLAEDHMAFQIVWPAVHVYWSDEQAQSFLAKVGVPGANMHPIRQEEEAQQAMRFDLIVLDALDSMAAPDRLSLAPAVIKDARAVMILASGEGVAAAARSMLGADGQDSARTQALRPANGQLLWLLDAEAASLLPLPETEGPPAGAGGAAQGKPRTDLSAS